MTHPFWKSLARENFYYLLSVSFWLFPASKMNRVTVYYWEESNKNKKKETDFKSHPSICISYWKVKKSWNNELGILKKKDIVTTKVINFYRVAVQYSQQTRSVLDA